MELTNMAVSKDARVAEYEAAESPNLAPEYPYGLRINLDADQILQLGLTGLPIKTELYMSAECCIIGINDDEGGSRMELQIKELAFKVEEQPKSGMEGLTQEKMASIMQHYGGK